MWSGLIMKPNTLTHPRVKFCSERNPNLEFNVKWRSHLSYMPGSIFDVKWIKYSTRALRDMLPEQQRLYSVDNGCCILTRAAMTSNNTVTFSFDYFCRESKEDQSQFYNVRVADVAIYIAFDSARPPFLVYSYGVAVVSTIDWLRW